MAAVERQVARVLSLGQDARGYAQVGHRDPAIRRLHEKRLGFRPVLFASPYEAAAWAIISATSSPPSVGDA